MTIFEADFCPYCGNELTTRWIENRERQFCESCSQVIYQNPVPCADVAVIDGSQVLLIKRENPPHAGKWALPGGIIEINESPEEAAVRELKEETNIDVAPEELSLIGTYSIAASGWYNVGYSYAISQNNANGTPTPGSDARDVKSWTLKTLHESDQELRPEPDDESQILNAIEEIHKD